MRILGTIILSIFLALTANAKNIEQITDIYHARMHVKIGEHSSTTNLWAKQGLMRISILSGRTFNTAITNYNQKKSWALSTSHMVFQEFASKRLRSYVPEFFNPALKLEKTLVGEETVNGIAAIKYAVKATYPGKPPIKGLLWEAVDLPGYPLQWEEPSRNVHAIWKNARLVSKPKSFFEVPSDYREQNAGGQTTKQEPDCNLKRKQHAEG